LPAGAGFPSLSINLVPAAIATPASFRYLFYDGGSEARAKDDTAVVKDRAPWAQWSCWEWEMRGQNEMYFSLHDLDLNTLTVTKADNWTGPPTVQLQLGMWNDHNDDRHPSGFNIWIDELAVNDKKMGCDF